MNGEADAEAAGDEDGAAGAAESETHLRDAKRDRHTPGSPCCAARLTPGFSIAASDRPRHFPGRRPSGGPGRRHCGR